MNECIPRPDSLFLSIARNGVIGFAAAAVADVVTNSARVIKTTKQNLAAYSTVGYAETLQVVLAADGWRGLFGRGLGTRVLTNGVQSVLFTILWEAFREEMAEPPPLALEPAELVVQHDRQQEQEQRERQQVDGEEQEEEALMDGSGSHIRGAPQSVPPLGA